MVSISLSRNSIQSLTACKFTLHPASSPAFFCSSSQINFFNLKKGKGTKLQFPLLPRSSHSVSMLQYHSNISKQNIPGKRVSRKREIKACAIHWLSLTFLHVDIFPLSAVASYPETSFLEHNNATQRLVVGENNKYKYEHVRRAFGCA